ncbi:MAG: hypothetical protein KatS3mg101_0129 [Patescibacteria group bacterium]|nr:MAG: hypothetical protein KatS3mg101_0129 [Patescibacteria group bacterium]
MPKRTGKGVESAIKRTLAYRALFHYPMSFFQIGTYLIADSPSNSKKLKTALNKLIKDRWARKIYGKYEILGEKYTNWLSKQKLSKKIIEENTPLLKFLGGIPWVRMIAITGSLAAYNPEKNSDIDLMLITKRNRLWITRGFVALILKILNKHPQFDGQPGSFCTNLFLDESKMQWEKEKRNIFIASDIVMIQPIVNKGDTYFKFISQNNWVMDYYPNFRINYTEGRSESSSGLLFSLLENMAREAQLHYMRKKITTEVLGKHIIHFNKNDNSRRILESYKNILKKLKIS